MATSAAAIAAAVAASFFRRLPDVPGPHRLEQRESRGRASPARRRVHSSAVGEQHAGRARAGGCCFSRRSSSGSRGSARACRTGRAGRAIHTLSRSRVRLPATIQQHEERAGRRRRRISKLRVSAASGEEQRAAEQQVGQHDDAEARTGRAPARRGPIAPGRSTASAGRRSMPSATPMKISRAGQQAPRRSGRADSRACCIGVAKNSSCRAELEVAQHGRWRRRSTIRNSAEQADHAERTGRSRSGRCGARCRSRRRSGPRRELVRAEGQQAEHRGDEPRAAGGASW